MLSASLNKTYPSSRYLSGPLPYVGRHITVNKMFNASLNKTFPYEVDAIMSLLRMFIQVLCYYECYEFITNVTSWILSFPR